MNPPDVLGALMLKHGCRCVYCNRRVQRVFKGDDSMATRDHIIPRGHGGTADFDNLTLACKGCNNKRGDMEQGEFIRLMASNAKPHEWRQAQRRAAWITFTKRAEVAALRKARGEQIITNAQRARERRAQHMAKFQETYKEYKGMCVYCDDACRCDAPKDAQDKGINWSIGNGHGGHLEVLACFACVTLIKSGDLTESQIRHVRRRHDELRTRHAVKKLASLPKVRQEPRVWPPLPVGNEADQQQGA